MNRRVRAWSYRSWLVAVVVVAAPVLLAGPASASCMLDERSLDERLAEAPIAFVGTVTGVRNADRVARFRVEEIWKGPELPAETVVAGTTEPEAPPGAPVAATSVDRTWSVGVRYLVMPRLADAGELIDDACSATQEWREEFAASRPADATVLDDESPADPSGGAPWGWVALGAGVVAVASLGAVVVRRSRSTRAG